MNKTILVTGGTGFIGSWVTKELLEKGYTVRLAVRDKGKKNKYQHLLEIENNCDGKLELWEANLLVEGSYDKAAEGCASIIHMASPLHFGLKTPKKNLSTRPLKARKMY